jgi:hypothetical protein
MSGVDYPSPRCPLSSTVGIAMLEERDGMVRASILGGQRYAVVMVRMLKTYVL